MCIVAKVSYPDLNAVCGNERAVGVRHHDGVIAGMGDHAAGDEYHTAAHGNPAGVEQVRAHV
jgi:hypothetical protein